MRALLAGLGILVFASPLLAAEEDSGRVEPYLQNLREKHDLQPSPKVEYEGADPRSDVLPKPLETPEQVEPYLSNVRQADPRPADSPGVQPYLEALKSGRELEPKKRTKVEFAAGLSAAIGNRYNLRSDKVQAVSFESVYDTNNKYTPGVDAFFEWQFWRDRFGGALGVIGHLGYVTAKGKGVFVRSGAQTTDTEFRFHAVPISAGLTYRFTQPRFVVPYVQASVMGVPFIETRNDDKASHRGISRGVGGVLGLALNLDWISRSNAWSQYDSYGVLHLYVFAQKEMMRTIGSPVRFDYDGTYLGFMVEY